MIKAIIFDCFGVIYPDTLYLATKKFIDVNDKTMSQRINSIRGRCDKGLISRDRFWNEVAEALDVSRQELDEELNKVRRVDWELLGFVKDLKTRYKTAMLSNVGKGFLEQIFDANHPQSDYFNTVIASGDTGFTKPDSQAYIYTAKQLGMEPKNCLMIDDMQTNCDGAIAVGMKAILYEDFMSMKLQLESLIRV